ncbi:MAG: hypothetical protein ACMUIS_09010 [bacterium]
MACCVLIVMSMLISPGTIHAGTLDDFEQEIRTNPQKTTYTPNTCYHADNEGKGDLGKEMLGECLSGCISSGCFKEVVGEFINAMNEGGTNSLAPDQTTSSEPSAPEVAPPPYPTAGTNTMAQIQTTSMDTDTPKAPPPIYSTGEPLITMLRLDMSYQHVESDVEAIDARFELGKGPLAVQYRHTSYREKEPDDTLHITQFHVLYRMSFIRNEGIDVGVGVMSIEGDEKNSGFSVTTPLHWHSSKGWGMEFRPGWAEINDNTIEDYTLVFFLSKRYVMLQAGYRWLSANTVSLNGPCAGLSILY